MGILSKAAPAVQWLEGGMQSLGLALMAGYLVGRLAGSLNR